MEKQVGDKSSGEKAKKRRRRSKRKGLDTAKLALSLFSDLRAYLGLDVLKLPGKLEEKIVYEVIDMLYSHVSSKPKLDAVLRKIKRFRDHVNAVIAAKILEEVENPSDEQLEFIVYSGGRAVIPEISKVYSLLKKRGREDLISYLESVWEKYGFPSPVKCPKCGFRAVMPNSSCYVCGYVVTEDYIRKELEFDEKLKAYVEIASVAELKDIADLGYVLVGEEGVFSPRYGYKLSSKGKLLYPVYLKSRDYIVINEAIASRKIEI